MSEQKYGRPYGYPVNEDYRPDAEQLPAFHFDPGKLDTNGELTYEACWGTAPEVKNAVTAAQMYTQQMYTQRCLAVGVTILCLDHIRKAMVADIAITQADIPVKELECSQVVLAIAIKILQSLGYYANVESDLLVISWLPRLPDNVVR